MTRHIIGIGATCSICNSKIQTGETYLSGWGNGTESVHLTCNLKRLGLDKSTFGSSVLASAASALGSKGGSSKSERKAASSRENGKRGGRPKKSE